MSKPVTSNPAAIERAWEAAKAMAQSMPLEWQTQARTEEETMRMIAALGSVERVGTPSVQQAASASQQSAKPSSRKEIVPIDLGHGPGMVAVVYRTDDRQSEGSSASQQSAQTLDTITTVATIKYLKSASAPRSGDPAEGGHSVTGYSRFQAGRDAEREQAYVTVLRKFPEAEPAKPEEAAKKA